MSQAFGSGTGDTYSETCGSDEWQIDQNRDQPSHSDTLECVWLLTLCDSDGTKS